MTRDGIDIHSLHLHNTTPAMIEAYEKVKHLDVAALRMTQQPTATMDRAASTPPVGECPAD